MAGLSATEFIDKLASDASFRNQVGISPTMSLDDFRTKAVAAGYNYTDEEIFAAAQTSKDGSLSDEQLDDVSGGVAGRSISISITIKF